MIPGSLLLLELTYADKARFFNWWLQIERLKQEKIPGAFAEVGVYKGKSARVLHRMDTSRTIYLFDTFSGFRKEDLELEQGKAATYSTIHFSDIQLKRAHRLIKGNQNVHCIAGNFPDMASQVSDVVFALVHLDADLYQPTRFALDFFYPRVQPGGVIMIHDYNDKWKGIMRATDEFIQITGETLIHVPDREGTVMIIKKNDHR
jgi:O-methyltransferase